MLCAMISYMTEQGYRQANMAKATAARVRAKHERWIGELTAAGYFVCEPNFGVGVVAFASGSVQVSEVEVKDDVLWIRTFAGDEIGLAGVPWYR